MIPQNFLLLRKGDHHLIYSPSNKSISENCHYNYIDTKKDGK